MKVMADPRIWPHVLLANNPSEKKATTEKQHLSLSLSKYGANPERTTVLLANNGWIQFLLLCYSKP